MELSQMIAYISGLIAVSLPQMLILLIGLFFCLKNRAKYPKASNTAAVGILILLALVFAGIILNYIQIQLPIWYKGSYNTIGYIIWGVNLFQSIVWSVGLGILIYSVWVGREES